MIYGTNLLTRCPMPVHVFCCLLFSEKLFGEVSRNHLKISVNYLHEGTKTEPGRGASGGPIAPRRHPGAAQPLAAWGSHLGDSFASSIRPFTYKLSSTRKPSIPDHILQKTSEAAAVANPRSGGFYSSSRHPVGGGIITEGINTTMPASGVMRE